MRAAIFLLALAACAGTTPSPAPAPSPATSPAISSATATPTATPTVTTPAPGAPVPGGSVLMGEIAGSKAFDPNPAVTSLKPQFESCYAQARASKPDLRGKLSLELVVNQSGKVIGVTPQPGGSADDPGFVTCLGEAIKAATFPKPKGIATLVLPLVFRQ